MTNEPTPPLLPTLLPQSPNNPTMEELMWRADIGRIQKPSTDLLSSKDSEEVMFIKCQAWGVKKEDVEAVDRLLLGKGFMTANDNKTLVTSGISCLTEQTEEEKSRIFSLPRCKFASII